MSTPDLNPGQPPELERNSGRRDPAILIVIAIVVSILLVFGIKKAHHSPVPTTSAVKLLGQPAPDFALQSLDRKTMKLSDFRGKAVLLNFWATYCVPCKIEIPWLVDFEKKYGSQGLEVLGVPWMTQVPRRFLPSHKE